MKDELPSSEYVRYVFDLARYNDEGELQAVL